MAKTVTTKRKDPFKELCKLTDKITIVSGSSGVKYYPEGLPFAVHYIPGGTVFKTQDLRWFGVVRKEAKQWLEGHTFDPPKRLPIIAKNVSMIQQAPIFRGCYYGDVSGAYWNTAYNLGIISKKTFQAVYPNKLLRNALLGSLAKKVDIFEWEKGKGKRLIQGKRKLPTNDIFFLIADYVTERMQFAMSDSFFMWVDCVYSPFEDIIETLNISFRNEFQFTFKENITFAYDFSSEKAMCNHKDWKNPKEYHFSRNFDFLDTE
jgi:hypothetical protein